MYRETPEFEVRIKGHRLLTVRGGEINIDGRDFHGDLNDLASLSDILSDILTYAKEARKPRLVSAGPPCPPGRKKELVAKTA